MFLRQQCGNGAGTLTHQACGGAHDFGAGDGWHVAPGLEAFLCGIQCEIQVCLAGMFHAANLFACGRVEHGQRLASRGFTPFAVDEKSGVWIAHGGLLEGMGIARMGQPYQQLPARIAEWQRVDIRHNARPHRFLWVTCAAPPMLRSA